MAHQEETSEFHSLLKSSEMTSPKPKTPHVHDPHSIIIETHNPYTHSHSEVRVARKNSSDESSFKKKPAKEATEAAAAAAAKKEQDSIQIRLAINISFYANILLFCSNFLVAVISRSMPLIAACVDSFVDFMAGAIVWLAHRQIRQVNPEKYPVGKTRLEAVGIVILSAVMGTASLELILTSLERFIEGVNGHLPDVDLTFFSMFMLGMAIVVKSGLYLFCRIYRDQSNSVDALAQDHSNDLVAFSCAIVAIVLHEISSSLWWTDPIGGMIMSIYILYSWVETGQEQVRMLTGHSADKEFQEQLIELASTHHAQMMVDVVRAYHFGTNYLVELEVVMPEEMKLREVHDIALELQQEVEKLDQVERCFVHVDYMRRTEPEHKQATLAGM